MIWSLLTLDAVYFLVPPEYKLVVVCSSEDQDKSHMVSKLQIYHRLYAGSLKPIHDFQEYLKTQFISWPEHAHKRALGRKVVASVVDLEKLAALPCVCVCVCVHAVHDVCAVHKLCVPVGRSSVRVVTSNRAGMGKSLCIKRLREALKTQISHESVEVVVPIHGPVVTADTVVETLMDQFGNARATIFHLDVAPNVCNPE